jgi:hypothetical protein
MAANAVISPEEEIVFEEKTQLARKSLKVQEPKLTPKPAGRKQRVKEMLATVFEGREEFLGRTPD